MNWVKVSELTAHDLVSIAPNMIFDNARIVARYKEEPDGIVLLAANMEQLIEMIDDTCPDDAMFEIWGKVDPNEDTPIRC